MKLLPSISFEPKYLSKVRSWHANLPLAFDLISELKPEIYVELGTHFGDSYFTFCQSVVENNLQTKCFAVDHWKGDQHSGFYNKDVFEKVQKYNNSYYSEFSSLIRKPFDDALDDFEDNSIGLLHIDGYHSYESVKNDFEKWFIKVIEGGVVLIHDTLVKKNGFQVYRFWDEICSSHTSYNLPFSFGLGVLVKCFKQKYDYLVNQEFDSLLKSRYYEKMGLVVVNKSKCE